MKKGNLIFTLFVLGFIMSLTLLGGQGSFAQEEDISQLRQKIDALEAKILELENILGECSELGATSEYGWQSKKIGELLKSEWLIRRSSLFWENRPR